MTGVPAGVLKDARKVAHEHHSYPFDTIINAVATRAWETGWAMAQAEAIAAAEKAAEPVVETRKPRARKAPGATA